MTRLEMYNGLKKLVNKKLKDGECKIYDKDLKEDFFIKTYDGNSYTLYKGCDLEIGDVPLSVVLKSLVNLHMEGVGRFL